MLKLMYITNDPKIASSAADAGVDRIFVDTEVLGKEARQGHLDSVKSHHSISDALTIRKVIGQRAQVLVRINPFHTNTKDEVRCALDCGADLIMLPMWKTVREVEEFCTYVDGKAIAIPLLETKEADAVLEKVLDLRCVDEFYIGLNDLHLSYGRRFMFELLSDGTVERLCKLISSYGIPYGFGGVGRPGTGLVPANAIIGEHYRLGSSSVILSRQFCKNSDKRSTEEILYRGILDVRNRETEIASWTEEDFRTNQKIVFDSVQQVLTGMIV